MAKGRVKVTFRQAMNILFYYSWHQISGMGIAYVIPILSVAGIVPLVPAAT